MPLTTDPKMLNLSRDVIEAFDKADRGPHPGFRPAHAKGILLTGEFKPSPALAASRFAFISLSTFTRTSWGIRWTAFPHAPRRSFWNSSTP
jgi:hypothetical protein